MDDWKNISFENDEQISEEELLKYFSDDVSEEEKYALEKKISSPFETDAVQGLSQIQNKESLEKHVGQLNLNLRQLTAKRPRKLKQKIKVFEWSLLALLLLLFICVIGFIIISLGSKAHLHTQISFAVQELVALL